MSLVSAAPRSPATVSTSESQRAVPRWRPPMEAAELRRILESLSTWSPLVLDEVFDDLNTAQDAHADTDPVKVVETAERLRKTLTHLVNIGHTTPRHQLPPEVARTVECAAPLVDLSPTGDAHAELGRLRRLAWFTQELVEQMSENRLIKGKT